MSSTHTVSRNQLFRRMLQDSALYTVALLVQRAVGILLLPVNTRFLRPSDYGTADLLEQVGVVISLLMGANIASSLGYFYFQRDDDAHRAQVAGTTVMGALLLGCLAAAIGWPFSGVISRLVFGNDTAAYYLKFVLISIIGSFTVEALFSWLRVTGRSGVFLAGSVLRVSAIAAGTLVFVAALRMRVLGVISSSLLALLLTNSVLGVYFLRHARPRWNSRLFLRMLSFTLAIALSGICMFIVHFGDRFILPHYRSLVDLGIYAVAYKIGMVVSIFSGTFGAYWNAQVYQVAKREDAQAVFAQTFTYLTAVLCFCGVGLVVAARPALRILAAPTYQGAVALVPILVAAYLVRGIADYFRAFFLVKGKPQYDAACNVMAALVSLGSYFLLIPRYGIWGAAWSTLATFLFLALIVPIWTWRLMRFSVQGARLLKLGLVSGLVLTGHRLIQVDGLGPQCAWAALLVCSFPALLWAIGFLTPGEREIALSTFARLTAVFSRAD